MARKNNLTNPEHQSSLEYLTDKRGLRIETLAAYHVGLDNEAFADIDGKYSQIPVMAFPMFRKRSKKERKDLRQ